MVFSVFGALSVVRGVVVVSRIAAAESREQRKREKEQARQRELGLAQARMKKYAQWCEDCSRKDHCGDEQAIAPVDLEKMESVRSKFLDEQPLVGIRLSYILEQFIPANGGIEAFAGMTTTDVINQIIKPHTQTMQESYWDYLKRHQGPETDACDKTASCFISHAHKYKFLDSIDALRYHLREDLDAYIFLDVFCINQHRSNWSYDFLSTTFLFSIKEFGRTIMIMSPWNDPVPFTRAWCLYEAHCTAATSGTFEIALSQTEKNNFLESIQDDTAESINKMLATIRGEKSQAFHKEECDRIHELIRKSVGFNRLNEMVFEQYRGWAISTSWTAYHQCTDDDQIQRLLGIIGQLYRGQGDYRKAEVVLRKRLAAVKSYGFSNAEYKAVSELMVLLSEKGDHNGAISLCVEVLDSYDATDSQCFHDVTKLLEQAGDIYWDRGSVEDARKLWQKCYTRYINTENSALASNVQLHKLSLCCHENGSMFDSIQRLSYILDKEYCRVRHHGPSTRRLMKTLALLYKRRGDLDKSQLMYKDYIEELKVALGPGHPETVAAKNDLANLMRLIGDFKSATAHLEDCLRERTMTLGESHPLTLKTMNALSQLQRDQGLYKEALATQNTCYREQCDILGNTHPDTIRSKFNMATIYHFLGDNTNYKELMLNILSEQQTTLGDSHKDTLATMEHLAAAFFEAHEFDLSAKLTRECLDCQAKVLGPNHPTTLTTLRTLAITQCQRSRYAEAAKLFGQCLQKHIDPADAMETLDIVKSLVPECKSRYGRTVLLQECMKYEVQSREEYDPDRLQTKEYLDIEVRGAKLCRLICVAIIIAIFALVFLVLRQTYRVERSCSVCESGDQRLASWWSSVDINGTCSNNSHVVSYTWYTNCPDIKQHMPEPLQSTTADLRQQCCRSSHAVQSICGNRQKYWNTNLDVIGPWKPREEGTREDTICLEYDQYYPASALLSDLSLEQQEIVSKLIERCCGPLKAHYVCQDSSSSKYTYHSTYSHNGYVVKVGPGEYVVILPSKEEWIKESGFSDYEEYWVNELYNTAISRMKNDYKC